jgi:urease beta subunit
MSNLNRGSFIDASCQVSVHLAKQFQRRRFKCEKLTKQRRQVMAKGHMTFRPGELRQVKMIPNSRLFA